MSDFRYLVEHSDGTVLYLSDEGPRKELPGFPEKLKRNGFHLEEERPMGRDKLCVFKRAMPATDIVPS
jgi:hypothetical protein